MQKVTVRFEAIAPLFAQIAEEAARLDRSPSWLVGQCLRDALPELASLNPKTREARSMKRRSRGSVARKETRIYFVPEDVKGGLDAEGARLELSTDQLLAWAFKRSAA